MKPTHLILRLATNAASDAYLVARKLSRNRNPMHDGYLRGWDHAQIHHARQTLKEVRSAVSPGQWRKIIAECRASVKMCRTTFAHVATQPNTTA